MKLIKIAIISMIIFLGYSNLVAVHNDASENKIHADKEIPPYAKWGRLAMKETKASYPNAAIIDYMHIGRDVQEKSSVEKFKLWLKEDNKEFGVYVNITFDTKTEKLIDIQFKETKK
ncbi:YqzG/YhdC family protein [Virgibacillus oceani]|uniref:DUF3889 domain-containing protein n=1 Tax=Virgibacillus oceani TaxID=1479511 RepID=A0A917HB70_9BACI|nr:YqzG/YhdC family protein [Virgibacillus oceani]GGG72390.1 hypothetical protein GCM10011398_15950 [Virgibacillus oceani]